MKADQRFKQEGESPVVANDMASLFKSDRQPKMEAQMVFKCTNDMKDQFYALCQRCDVDPSTVMRRFMAQANEQMSQLLAQEGK